MKKLMVLIISFVTWLSWVSSGYAAELLGYSIVPKQAKFYIIILGVMGASGAMVSALYFFLWMADLKKKKKVRMINPAFIEGGEAFEGPFAAASQSAK
jgi:uncharacterized membrane protein YeaQ/YmgE (transglycosylase-associated protein family)